MGQQHHPVSARELLRLIWASVRALLPTLVFDLAGTMAVYYLLLPHFGKGSIWPILGASLVPVISNVYNFIRRRVFDVVGLIILIGLLAGVVPALFGGNQRLLLVRESFVTGALGVVLIISAVRHRPIAFYVIREFLTANETLPEHRFDTLWASQYFRRTTRAMTLGWGILLLGEFVLRAFMALRMNVAFVLGAAPVIATFMLLIAGLFTAYWLAHAIRVALSA